MREKKKTMTILHEIWVERVGTRLFTVQTDETTNTYEADTLEALIEKLNAELREYYNPKREARIWHFGGVEEVYHKIGKVHEITK